MSSPDNIYVTFKRDEKSFSKVWISSHGGEALFNYLLPRLQQLDMDSADQFEGEYYGDVLSISSMPARHYPEVCRLIMQACDELAVLQPYREELRQVLYSDPRIKQAEAA